MSHLLLVLPAFALGSFSSALWPALPPPTVLVGICLAALLGAALGRRGRRAGLLLAAVAAGVLWAAVWGAARLHAQLPAALDKTDWQVYGEVAGLPDRSARRLGFELRVLALEPPAGVEQAPPLRRLRLSWYGEAPQLRPGERWHLRVRLRSPRGFANPGGFDYAGWLFARGVSATGYVRVDPGNRPSAELPRQSIDAFRWRVAERIDGLPLAAEVRGLLRALTVGDGGALSAELWDRLRVTGLLHLAVVSGQHIGLAAGLGMLLGSAAGRLLQAAGGRWPARHAGALCAWAMAGGYAAMAGFGLATTRAFVMLSVLMLVLLQRRRAARLSGLLWALAAIAVLEPLAPLALGFWLSFGAVAALMIYFGARPGRGWWRGLALAQVVVPLGTTVGLLWFQGEVPLLAPLINLPAVPWVSLVSVPLCLLGLLAMPVWPPLADALWSLAGLSLQGFDQVLLRAAELSAQWRWGPAAGLNGSVLGLLGLASVCLLAPPGLALRRCALFALLWVVLAGEPRRPPLQVTVLDVGQGLATVVETAHHVLVYDAGPAFGERFDAGSDIVARYLRRRGWRHLDMLLVSHEDLDHSGGVAGLVGEYPPRRELRGMPAQGAGQCRAGQHWAWDGVRFRVLHPQGSEARDNDHSCVLLVESGAARVLLTGDIERRSEAALLAGGALPAGVTLLVAPHHGSRTSSSPEFVAWTRPRQVVYAAGHRHHFGHPHPEVVARYAAVGARAWHTAAAGAVQFVWRDPSRAEDPEVQAARAVRRRYWDGG